MAAEVSLKEESAIEIGKQLAFSFQGLKAVGADTANGGLELEEEKEQTSYLEKISGGIKKMVVFFGGLAASIKEARRDRLIKEGQSTELGKEAGDKDEGTGIITQSFKDKIKKLTDGFKTTIMPVFGIFKGLLGKAALFGLLLAFALNLDKFSDDLKPIVKKLVDGFKAAFTSFKENFFPIMNNFIELIGSVFDSVQNILKIFEGDFKSFFKGVGGLGDIALRVIGIIGDAFFSLVEGALKFFGIDSKLVTFLKNFFRELPETIKKAVQNFIDFFKVDIPNKFNEIKTNITTGFTDMVTKVKNSITGIADEVFKKIKDTFTEIKELFFKPFGVIKDKVKAFFGFGTDTVTGGDPEAAAQANAITENKSKSEALMDQRDKLMAQGPKDDSNSAQRSFEFKIKKLNARIIKEEGRDNDHKKVNITSPIEYAMADSAGTIDSFVQEKINPSIVGEADKLPETYNTPVIEPNEFMNNGGQLNKDSQEFASTNVMPPSMNVVTGGTTNTTSSNTTVTNIAESTTTSDNALTKKIFKSS